MCMMTNNDNELTKAHTCPKNGFRINDANYYLEM